MYNYRRTLCILNCSQNAPQSSTREVKTLQSSKKQFHSKSLKSSSSTFSSPAATAITLSTAKDCSIELVRGNVLSISKFNAEGHDRCTIEIRDLEEEWVMVIASIASYKY